MTTRSTTSESSAGASPEPTTCALCGCPLHRGSEYAEDSIPGRSHATKHHLVAERFFGTSKTRRGKAPRTPVLGDAELADQRQVRVFCYECHEELLHNPVLYPEDVRNLANLFALNGVDEREGKLETKQKLASRIHLLHRAVSEGIRCLLREAEKEAGHATD